VKECPCCGLPAIDVTVSGDPFQKFMCPANHRWELRPIEGAESIVVEGFNCRIRSTPKFQEFSSET